MSSETAFTADMAEIRIGLFVDRCTGEIQRFQFLGHARHPGEPPDPMFRIPGASMALRHLTTPGSTYCGRCNSGHGSYKFAGLCSLLDDEQAASVWRTAHEMSAAVVPAKWGRR